MAQWLGALTTLSLPGLNLASAADSWEVLGTLVNVTESLFSHLYNGNSDLV